MVGSLVRAFGLHITGLIVCLTQQVVLAAPDFSQMDIDKYILLSSKLLPYGNSRIKKCRHSGPIQIFRSRLVTSILYQQCYLLSIISRKVLLFGNVGGIINTGGGAIYELG